MAAEPFSLYVHGRLHGVTRGRLTHAVAAVGGRLLRVPSSRCDLVALGHGTAFVALVQAPPIALPAGIPPSAQIISEHHLKRLLGLLPMQAEELRVLSAADIAHMSSLDEEVVRCLALYDVLDPKEGEFGFRDLRAAREVRRLLDLHFGLDEIVEAAIVLRRNGRGLFDTSLTEAPWGEIMQHAAGRWGHLDGQYALPLDEQFESVDDIFSRAEECELAGDLEHAERLYRIAMSIDRSDPVIPYNLANVVNDLGRPADAMLAYQQAIALDASFSEAWVNIANLHQDAGRQDAAEESLRKALDVQPNLDTALYNLALLLTNEKRFADAWPLWNRYLSLTPLPDDAGQAARMAMLCRLEAVNDRQLVPASE